MSAISITAVNLAGFANQSDKFRNPLEDFQKDRMAGNIPNAQAALALYSKQLALIGVRNNQAPSNPIGASVQGLQNALSAGDLAAAKNLALTVRQGSAKIEPEAAVISEPVEPPHEANGTLLDFYA